MRSMLEAIVMGRDFLRVVRGRDYFHQPQTLGSYFVDPRCYYNNFQGKADWDGATKDGVPLLHLPALGSSIEFPIMILQFGLGSLDRWFLRGGERYRLQIESVMRWIRGSLNERGHFENHFVTMEPDAKFISDNSGMTQGEALSFLRRVIEQRLLSENLLHAATDYMRRIFDNMVLPVEEGGTACRRDGELVFCEVCREDQPLVLNGWIYAIFGLYDFVASTHDQRAADILRETIASLRRIAPQFLLPSGWSAYDNRGRIASPFYHSVHVHLFDALARLVDDRTFANLRDRLKAANNFGNKAWYTLHKVKDKLLDTTVYTSSSGIGARQKEPCIPCSPLASRSNAVRRCAE